MRLLAKIGILFLTISLVHEAQGQNHTVIATPKIWLTPDSAGTLTQWTDQSGNGNHAYNPGGTFDAKAGLFNYQPCFVFDSLSEALRIDYVPEKKAKIVVFAIYKPFGSGREHGLWSLRLDSAARVAVTTQYLNNFYARNQYADSTATIPAINLLSFYWRSREIDSTRCGINVVGTDSLLYSGKFAEFMFYDTVLKQNEITRIHTYLAVKYGISIREMNYVNSMDTIVWNTKTDSLYSNRIAGIGKDSLLLIDQKQSCAIGGEARLVIAAGNVQETNALNRSVIDEMNYLIWGDNGKELILFGVDDNDSVFTTNLSECVWLMKRSGGTANNINTQVVIKAPEMAATGQLNLVISRETDFQFLTNTILIIPADTVDTLGNFYFNNVHWDTDNSGSDAFTFQFVEEINNRSQADPNANNETQEEPTFGALNSIEIFPNPTNGQYRIVIALSTVADVLLSIQDENGKCVSKNVLQGSSQYSYDGTLTEKGCYLIKVETAQEAKTIKLIVQ